MLDDDCSSLLERLDETPARVTLAALVCLAAALTTSTGLACDYTLESEVPNQWPDGEQVEDFPSNGILVYAQYQDPSDLWESNADDPTFAAVEPLSTRLNDLHPWFEGGAWRAEGGLEEGITYRSEWCSSQSNDCTMTVGPPDETPPAKPVIDEVTVRLVKNGVRAGAVDCPDLDTMDVTVSGSDDRTPGDALIPVAYFGDTPERALKAESASYVWRPQLKDDGTLYSNFVLGTAHDHNRSGDHFRQESYCFSIALIDRAGNESERSEPHCIDTVDPNHPDVVERESDRAACSTTGLAGPARSAVIVALLLLSALMLGFRQRS